MIRAATVMLAIFVTGCEYLPVREAKSLMEEAREAGCRITDVSVSTKKVRMKMRCPEED